MTCPISTQISDRVSLLVQSERAKLHKLSLEDRAVLAQEFMTRLRLEFDLIRHPAVHRIWWEVIGLRMAMSAGYRDTGKIGLMAAHHIFCHVSCNHDHRCFRLCLISL